MHCHGAVFSVISITFFSAVYHPDYCCESNLFQRQIY